MPRARSPAGSVGPGSGETASTTTESIRLKLFELTRAIEELRDQLAPASRPNQTLSRLEVPHGPGRGPGEGRPASATGSVRSRTSREQTPARSRKSVCVFLGSPVHQRTCGRSASSSDRTAPGSKVDGVWSGAQDDPFGAHLRLARVMANGRVRRSRP